MPDLFAEVRPILACHRTFPAGDCAARIRLAAGGVTHWEQAGEYDAYVPLSGLPRLAEVTTQNIPFGGLYLAAKNTHKLEAWRAHSTD